MKKIAIIVTLDTKSEEAAYLRELITRLGHQALIIDIGSGGEPGLEADITAAEVAQAAGETIAGLRASRDKDSVSETMIAGAVAKLRALCRADELEGLISVGGATGAIMASGIMREMPYRIPKLIFSSAASLAGSHRWFGPTGVTVMHCLVDVSGLNRLLEEELNRAAGAICGMAESEALGSDRTAQKPAVAMTTNKWVETPNSLITEALADEYEVIHFHATGAPEVFMEKLIEEDYFKAVIDLVPSSITNEAFGGARIAWPRRMEVAGEKGIPQVMAPCLLNVISRPRESPEAIADVKVRKHYFIDRQRVLLWLTAQEVIDMAPVYASKINKATGPTKFLVPLKGWSTIETVESEYYDRDAVQGFIEVLKREVKPTVEIREIDANIDSAAFAEAALVAFREVMGS